jgi:hypothetical protein
VWASFFLFVQSPVLMVQIGGIGGGVFLLAVVIAAWRLRSTGVEKRFRGSPWLTVALAVSSTAIVFLGVYGVLDVFGISLTGSSAGRIRTEHGVRWNGRSSRWPPPTRGRRMDWPARGGRVLRQVAGER